VTFRISVSGGTILSIDFTAKFTPPQSQLSVYQTIYGKYAQAVTSVAPA
jgi:hypothetical protein